MYFIVISAASGTPFRAPAQFARARAACGAKTRAGFCRAGLTFFTRRGMMAADRSEGLRRGHSVCPAGRFAEGAMQVTRENKEAVKLFIKIPVDFKLSEEAVKMIVTMLQSEARMDELAAFIAKNVDMTETALFERAATLCRAGKTARVHANV